MHTTVQRFGIGKIFESSLLGSLYLLDQKYSETSKKILQLIITLKI